MTISLTISGNHAAEVIAEMQQFFRAHPEPANNEVPYSPPLDLTKMQDVAAAPAKRGKKAPAADAVIDQPKNDVPMLTIDDARERMRKFNSDGHMDQSAAALKEFTFEGRECKKLSEVDPEAGGNPSPKYHALVTRIEALIAEKAA